MLRGDGEGLAWVGCREGGGLTRIKVLFLALAAVATVACLLADNCAARQDFLDACKQEQPIERCEQLWKNGETR